MLKNKEESCSMCAAGFHEEKEPEWKKKSIAIIVVSFILLLIGIYFEFISKQKIIAQTLFVIVVIVSGHNIIKKGFLNLARKRRFDMNFLMSIAAIGAFLIGHGEEGAAVMFLFFIAEFLENYAGERNKKSIQALLNVIPDMATMIRGSKKLKVHTHNVKKNEIIIVKPGDKIPLDGVVAKGYSAVNQASITGESIPVEKKKNDKVFAGTINETGYLEIKVTKKSNETMLAKIVKVVEEAQRKKSKTESFIDKFSKYYTPTVIAFAFLVMIIPPIFFNLSFKDWLYRGLVLLVVSCPCAMAISTPVSMVSGITSGARNGLLIKGGSYLEEIRKAKVIAFDKTGTLTVGKPEVTDVIPLNNYSKAEILGVASSLESLSKHPIAETIVNQAKKEKLKLLKVSKFESVSGKGIKGSIKGETYYIGNKNYFENLKINFPEKEVMDLEKQGKTLILIGNKNQIIGIIAVMDRIRDNAFETIKMLKDNQIKTVMLTGDNERTAKAIAKKLGIDEYYAELLPEDKVDIIEKLLEKHEHVVMIGDGVNDAPALAKAHVGIAMGAIGSDVAIETADITLMQDDLSKVNYLLKLSRKTMNVVKQNVFSSILIKGSFAVLAFPGIVTLWLAVAVGDMGLSLAVILNAIRIGHLK